MKYFITFEFENGKIFKFKTLGCALEYAHKNNTRLVRQY